MGEKIIVGPKFGGLINAVEPFAIDDESFPFLLNAYTWRGRLKRKRGTSLLTRLQRYFDSTSTLYNSGPTFVTLDGTGFGNILAGFSIPLHASIVPGSVRIDDIDSPGLFYTDPGKDGILVGNPSGAGVINYTTGNISIPVSLGHRVTAQFIYNPDLPVLGLRALNLTSTQFPGTIAFDPTYAYNIPVTSPNSAYSVSFYKNPPSATINLAAYVAKTVATPTTWNGQDYQQFWSTNYQNAFWATNGIPVPFVGTNIGMQFQVPASTTWTNATTITFTILNCPLVQGDWVFVNEFKTGGNPATSLNFQTGFVSLPVVTVGPLSTVVVVFPYAVIANVAFTDGIIQYLTNRSDPTVDCLRWYDGDPTNGSATAPLVNTGRGWVNFAPPLSNLEYNVGELSAAQYYLVGARMIVPFKDRLIFFGPVVQTSSPGSQRYLQDTIVYSQNGTAFYTASFDGTDPISAMTIFFALLTPGAEAAIKNETATANAYWEDQTGLGGFITAGYEQPITTVSFNEDVLIVGFSVRQAKLIYSGNDDLPFNFYVINSELGSASTFSAINLDRSVITAGQHGFVMTSQIGAQRFDLQIPDNIFKFALKNNGVQRVTAQRDFINEWVYFTFCNNDNNYPSSPNKFPNQTLQYNYREESWAVFNESYTSYGQFRKVDGLTWAAVGKEYGTWARWDDAWNSSASTLLQPRVIGGNQQGFVLERDKGTHEGNSLYITNISFPSVITGATNANPAVLTSINTFVVGQMVTISGVVGMTQLNGNTYPILGVTPTTITIDVNSTAFGVYVSGGLATPDPMVYSPNHGLLQGDYITINGAIGTVPINGKIFSVANPNQDGFDLDPDPEPGTYIGNGFITRMYVPLAQSKQFNPSWGSGRKTRIGVQQYLLSRTADSQITLLIYLSQNSVGSIENAYNSSAVVPDNRSVNDGLIYSAVLYTCPESSNLGLTPPNTNLQMVTANEQRQVWHRINTSLLGDTVQVGFTMSDAQMRDPLFTNQFSEIEIHSFIIDVTPSQLLS